MSRNRAPAEIAFEPGDATLRRRLVLVCSGLVCAFSLISWRLIHLQVVCHRELADEAGKHRMEQQVIEAPRGRLFDARGTLIARDEPVRRIVFDLSLIRDPHVLLRLMLEAEKKRIEELKEKGLLNPAEKFDTAGDIRSALPGHRDRQQGYIERAAAVIAPFLATENQPAPAPAAVVEKILARRAESESGRVVLERQMSVANAVSLRDAMDAAGLGKWHATAGHIGALRIEEAFVRRLSGGVPLDHLAGRIGEKRQGDVVTTVGVSGVERACNDQLTPRNGLREFEVDGAGLEIPGYRRICQEPEPGRNLRLTVDAGLQKAVTETMMLDSGDPATSMKQLAPLRAICVLFDPATMAIRAVVAIDRNLPEDRPMTMNHAVEYSYQPGSTIKIATIGAGLDSRAVALTTSFDLHGGLWEPDGIKSIRDHKAMDSGTTRDIFIESSNIGSYQVALRMGARTFERYLRGFGFAAPTGTQLPLDTAGWFPKNWQGDYLSRASFGYGLQVTPLQMCGLLGCMMNGGVWRTPRMVEGYTDDKGRIIEPWPEGVSRQVVSRSTAGMMCDLLRDVVADGTGGSAEGKYYSMSGKTGSALKPLLPGETTQKFILSFIGFMPSSKPKLGGILIVDEPALAKDQAWGSKVAGPVFSRIMERAMAYYQVPPEFDPEVAEARK